MSARTSKLIDGLRRSSAYPHDTSEIDVIETHISYVVLTGDFAYKIKKDVRLPFVNFSTLERRRHFCERELMLNRRTAAEMYRDVVPIGGSVDSPVVGKTPAIEYAVRMLQFDPDDTADRLLDRDALTAEMLRDLASRLVAFHATLDPCEGKSPIERMRNNLDQLVQEIDARTPGAADSEAGYAQGVLERIESWTHEQNASLCSVFEARISAGNMRDCHGDLHLGNLALIDGALVPFDCLEFDDELRAIDIVDEIAFLAMDLMAHERADLAHVFLNACLQESGDYTGLAVVPYYLIHRALVRSKVRRLSVAKDASAGASKHQWPYLSLAGKLTQPGKPRLVITTGYSGSGKTTVTEALIESLPAIRVRSDLERKRIRGLAARASSDSPVGGGIYDEAANEATYDRLHACAAAALAVGVNVIVDATFLSHSNRRCFADLASAHDADFVMLNCKAPEAVLRQRIEARRRECSDSSEAFDAVLDAQLRKADPLDESERNCSIDVDTTQKLDARALARMICDEADAPKA